MTMYRSALRSALRDRLVAVVALLALAVLLVFLFLIERRNQRLRLRTPSIFMPMEPPQ